jgi:hypothetical protein
MGHLHFCRVRLTDLLSIICDACMVLEQVLSVVGILQDEADPMVSVMKASSPAGPAMLQNCPVNYGAEFQAALRLFMPAMMLLLQSTGQAGVRCQ